MNTSGNKGVRRSEISVTLKQSAYLKMLCCPRILLAWVRTLAEHHFFSLYYICFSLYYFFVSLFSFPSFFLPVFLHFFLSSLYFFSSPFPLLPLFPSFFLSFLFLFCLFVCFLLDFFLFSSFYLVF